MKILLVADNISLQMGGEAITPFFHLRELLLTDHEVYVLAHGRVRRELQEHFPEHVDRMWFIEDSSLDRLLSKVGRKFSERINSMSFRALMVVITQIRMRPVAKKIVKAQAIDVVHQAYPISPKIPSGMYGLGAPVVIGPLSGAMNFPPGFRWQEGLATQALRGCLRKFSDLLNRVIPGKLHAEVLIVANEQTRAALPKPYRGQIHQGSVPEIGFEAKTFGTEGITVPREQTEIVRLIYVGRLVFWKGVHLLLQAIYEYKTNRAFPGRKFELILVGDGQDRAALEAQVDRLGIRDDVTFLGWKSQTDCATELRKADIFVLPSLSESGGIVVLEAMASGLPIIATNWGGPSLTVKDHYGLKVDPVSPEKFVHGLAEAIDTLVSDDGKRKSMGLAAMKELQEGKWSWADRTQKILDILATVARAK